MYHDHNNVEKLAGRGLWLLRLYGRIFRLVLALSLVVVAFVLATLLSIPDSTQPPPRDCLEANARQYITRETPTAAWPVCPR